MVVGIPLAAALLLHGCSHSPEDRLRKLLARQVTGEVRLPPGEIEVSAELRLASGAHDLTISGSGTTLRAATGFQGRAILVGESVTRVRFVDFAMKGNRSANAQEMAPPENEFRVFYPNNGILLDRAQDVEIEGVRFRQIVNFAILVSRSSGVRVDRASVEDSGSLNARGRNNTTGGIVFEEGSSHFEVRDSVFRRIRGNALWTHSMYRSARLQNGLFVENEFDTIGRDAIQVGHAQGVRVEGNRGSQIGWPIEVVDVENGGTPVGIDTSGNVDHSTYVRNRFEEINGKCIDLDGFHDGSVVENECINRKPVGDYPFGHFGIVMNNANPDMQSESIEIAHNHVQGTKFGGLFLIGSGHRVIGNVFEGLNLAGCGCIYKADEPAMLESGIYLGRGAERPASTLNNVIRDNRIEGYKMSSRCLAAAPGVKLQLNAIEGNRCIDQ